ncbi:hypothetical protein [Paraburkholderia sediminicola]|uniref:hypothetical protein n=1 Tax=Paraburkholderia sediminicola TaxID=458836 RepID=UPI0038BD3F39
MNVIGAGAFDTMFSSAIAFSSTPIPLALLSAATTSDAGASDRFGAAVVAERGAAGSFSLTVFKVSDLLRMEWSALALYAESPLCTGVVLLIGTSARPIDRKTD